MKQIKYILGLAIILNFVFTLSVLAKDIGQINNAWYIVEENKEFNLHVEIKHAETYYTITMELIGEKKDDVLVEILDEKHIIISGERKQLLDDPDNKDHEGWHEAFTRSVTLPCDADMAMVSAKFHDELLTIFVRRAAQELKILVTRRMIEIK